MGWELRRWEEKFAETIFSDGNGFGRKNGRRKLWDLKGWVIKWWVFFSSILATYLDMYIIIISFILKWALQSISPRDYHLMASFIDEHQHNFSLAFNVRRCFSIVFNELRKGILADFYFIFQSHFSLQSILLRLFREFSWAERFNMITSRHDLEREIIASTDGEKACRR